MKFFGYICSPPWVYPPGKSILIDDGEWHVVLCRVGHALRAAEIIASLDCVVGIYAPTRVIERFFGTRRVERRQPWLGSMVLARWDGNDPYAWHDVVGIGEVSGILGGWPPSIVPDAAVRRFMDTIQLIESKGQVILQPPCAPGDWIRFTQLEIFHRVLGVCLWASAGVVGVRVRMLGRDTVLQVPYEGVEGMVENAQERAVTTLSQRRGRYGYRQREQMIYE